MEACPTQLTTLKGILHSFALSTGLRVNYNKTVMVPINVPDDRMSTLANTFGCQVGELPFTYLGLPLGTTKRKVEAFLPLVQRIERRLTFTSTVLTQGGKLEMVNSVFSSSAVYHCSTIKLHKEVIKQIDKYRKHCLWRGSDLNAKQPPKATWPVVCLPKVEGGLGVINIETHNDSMLLKFLHKFFSRADIPWVNLVWDNYYSEGELPGQRKRGSFWWRDIVKLLHSYKQLVTPVARDGASMYLWYDRWNGVVTAQAFPELFSFARNQWISLKNFVSLASPIQHFHTPLSVQGIWAISGACG